MFSIADLLERAKQNAHLESDYRLAKVLRINQSALSNYRAGRNLPNVEIVEALCALSGDDAGLLVAQVEAQRAADGPVRAMWLSVAKRLSAGASTAILSVLFAIGLIAVQPMNTGASGPNDFKTVKANSLYIVSSSVFVRWSTWLELHRWRIMGFFRLCTLAAL